MRVGESIVEYATIYVTKRDIYMEYMTINIAKDGSDVGHKIIYMKYENNMKYIIIYTIEG